MRKRIPVIFLFVSLLMIVWIVLPAVGAQAGNEQRSLSQQETDYPYPMDTYEIPTFPGYDGPTGQAPLTPTPPPGGVTTTPTPSPVGSGTQDATAPTDALNPLTPSPTGGENLFGTEDSEMGSARITPPASETPIPSSTSTGLPLASATPAFMQSLQFKREWFAIGFLIPIGLLALGWVGYRLLRSGEFSGKA